MLLIFNNIFEDQWDQKYLCWAMFQISSIHRWTSSVLGDKGKRTRKKLPLKVGDRGKALKSLEKKNIRGFKEKNRGREKALQYEHIIIASQRAEE